MFFWPSFEQFPFLGDISEVIPCKYIYIYINIYKHDDYRHSIVDTLASAISKQFLTYIIARQYSIVLDYTRLSWQ